MAGVAAIALVVTGCSSAAESQGSGKNGVITVTVGDRPPSSQPELQKALDTSIQQFQAANPNIKVVSKETSWNAQTFQALLAGGQMPTVMGVPFTEPASLIKNHQVADITAALKATGLDGELNQSVLSVAQIGGATYGVPTDVYSVGLAYNRALFKQAGLDPDRPPTTWEQVRTYAAAIAKATHQAGYATYDQDHFGGWMTTAATYSFGGRLEDAAGTKATLAIPELKAYLNLVRTMRWTDTSMGSNFNYSAKPALQDFAAGKIGMILNLPQDYPAIVQNYKMDPDDYGFAALPQQTGTSVSLSGGIVQVFNPRASEAEIVAGLKWIKFNRFNQYSSQAAAVAAAQAATKDGALVGLPALTPLSQAKYQQYQEWIKPLANVPVANFAGYTAVADKQSIVPEPRGNAQYLYGQLDVVLQAVLTNKDADIDALLRTAEQNVDGRLGH